MRIDRLARLLPIAAMLAAVLLPSSVRAQPTQGDMPDMVTEQVQQYGPDSGQAPDAPAGPGDYGPGYPPGYGRGPSAADRMRAQIEALGRSRQQAPQDWAYDAGDQSSGDELVIALPRGSGSDAASALLQRHALALVEQLDSDLGDALYIRARILDQRPVTSVAAAVAADPGVILAQPNLVYQLQRAPAAAAARPSSGEPPLQYALAKLRLPQAHGVAKGDQVLVGVIDSGVDDGHPDLAGSVAANFDAIGGPAGPHSHGTAIASLIAGHGRMVGAAPDARILAARAFDSARAKGSSFTVLKSLDWLGGHGARIVNMSFAGPQDAAVHRMIEGAYRRGIILVAAAGNAGPSSPPLYPAAEPHVIAVTATDAGDRLFARANRGGYIAVAAPGVDLFVAAPDGGYGIQSGTSFSAAEVSGIAALILQKRPKLAADAMRAQLTATARALGPGVKLADAYGAVTAGGPAKARR